MKNLLTALLIALAPSLLIAQAKLPSVTVQTLDGKKINTSTWSNNGKPIIVNFWATWCAPCKRELSAIADKYDNWQQETGVKLIAVSIDDARSMAGVFHYLRQESA